MVAYLLPGQKEGVENHKKWRQNYLFRGNEADFSKANNKSERGKKFSHKNDIYTQEPEMIVNLQNLFGQQNGKGSDLL